jgi:hypothetical protein
MANVLRTVGMCAVCAASFVLASAAAAQPAADPPPANLPAAGLPAQGTASVHYLDSQARAAGVAITGPIDKVVAAHGIELLKSLRPSVDDLTVYLDSPGGDAAAAMELGQEIRNQWVLATVDDGGECLGACVLLLAAGVRRTPAPDTVGLHRPSDPKNAALTKRVQTYLARMGMPERLFKEMMQHGSDKTLVLDAAKLKTFGLEGVFPPYEEWSRANANQRPPQSN